MSEDRRFQIVREYDMCFPLYVPKEARVSTDDIVKKASILMSEIIIESKLNECDETTDGLLCISNDKSKVYEVKYDVYVFDASGFLWVCININEWDIITLLKKLKSIENAIKELELEETIEE